MHSTDALGTRRVTVRCPSCQTRNRIDMTRLAQRPRCGGCRRPMLLDRPLMVTEADLEDSIRSAEVPVVLDCYADWCGPCKATAPALAALAGQHAGRVLVLKLDTDRYPGAAQRLGIRGIPTLIAFREGRELHRHVGMASLPQLEALAGVV